MHNICNAPGGADCPTDKCGACRFRRDPLTPKEIVAEVNRLMSVLIAPAADNYDEIEWMTRNGWLEIELNVSKTEKFIELEKMLSNEKEKLEEENKQ